MVRGHERFEVRKVRHQLGEACQARLTVGLNIAEGLHGVGQVARQSVPNVASDGALHDQQRNRCQSS